MISTISIAQKVLRWRACHGAKQKRNLWWFEYVWIIMLYDIWMYIWLTHIQMLCRNCLNMFESLWTPAFLDCASFLDSVLSRAGFRVQGSGFWAMAHDAEANKERPGKSFHARRHHRQQPPEPKLISGEAFWLVILGWSFNQWNQIKANKSIQLSDVPGFSMTLG